MWQPIIMMVSGGLAVVLAWGSSGLAQYSDRVELCVLGVIVVLAGIMAIPDRE